MQGNNFFFHSDPLLGGNYDTQYCEYERLQQALEEKKRMLMQTKEQMMNAPSQSQSNTPVWDEIDSIVSSMSDKEANMIFGNDEFVESQNVVMSILQSQYMKMMRPLVEGTPEGKDALEKHLTLVKRLRKSVSSEVEKELDDFQEYKEKYSDIPYSEYQKMRRDRKGGNK